MANLQIVPACKNVEAQYVEKKVPLYSYGCERKVKKASAHLRGIYSVKVYFEEQKVTVWGMCNKYDVPANIKNKTTEACFWNSEDNHEHKDPSSSVSPSSLCPTRRRRSSSLWLIIQVMRLWSLN